MNIYEKLLNIQTELKAPKSNRNSFGGYSYRTTEDILEAVKPLLSKYKATLTVSDELVLIGDRYYIKATAIITDIETGEYTTATGYAREDVSKKGMDLSQLTGATSSYARKYALNGLLSIDSSELDPDTNNKHIKEEVKEVEEEKHPSFEPIPVSEDDDLPFFMSDDFKTLGEATSGRRARRRKE